MRLIDADDFRSWLLKQKRLSKNYTLMMLDESPTIDLVKCGQPFKWTFVEDKLPDCDWGTETAPVLFIFGSTVFGGYYGRGGKLRDSYFRQYNDVHEGVDSKDVIAWAWASSLNPPKKE